MSTTEQLTPGQLRAIAESFATMAEQEEWGSPYAVEIGIDGWQDSYPEGTARLAIAWTDSEGLERKGWTFFGRDGSVLDVFEPF